MNVIVIITGLVLLAPDPDHRQLHLFFPEVDWRHPQMEHHTPYLGYPTATRQANVVLEGWALDLGTLASPGDARAIPSEVVDLGALFDWSVPRGWVTGVPASRVQGRITLPWPDSFRVDATAPWRVERGTMVRRVPLTNELVLTYESPLSPPASWRLNSLPSGPGGSEPIPSLQLGGSTSTIHISNLPAAAGPDMTLDSEGVHFQGYVDILRRRVTDRLLPRPRVFLDVAPGSSAFNCMLATVPMGS